MSSDNSGTAPSISRGGRPTHALWQYFKKLDTVGNKSGRYKASCNFCGKIFRDGRITDHAAGTERCFSVMSWYHSKARNRMLTRTVAMMTTIKAHLDAERQT